VLVIFDCDGVLVDSERQANQALTDELALLGIHLTLRETMDVFMGRSWKSCVAEVTERLGHAPPDSFTTGYMRRRDEALATDLEAIAGVVDIVEHLHARGIATCVASSGEHDKMGRTLRATGLWDAFAGRIYSATEVEHGKPAPDLFLHAAAGQQADPADCVVVEDAPAGVAGGKAAGMRVLAYAALTPAGRLADAGADAVFTDMAELPALLGVEDR
jgi:HAD superfamily hydrolase (TIGR01509 family)